MAGVPNGGIVAEGGAGVTADLGFPNLDDVKNKVREYYGDYVDANGRHQCSFTSAWARDVELIVGRAEAFVSSRLAEGVAKPALVLDVDDTAVTTYPYLANTGFGTRQNREVLPAIPPILDLARYAHGRDVAIFFVTVRLAERRADTLANLDAVGYPPPDGLFLKPTTPPFPPYMPSPDCSPAAFKSSVRAHIQATGYRILASIGDQISDLAGGYAEMAFKLPNPMYHTP